MLSPRIIPCLLIHKEGLVKTKQFKDHKYVGDPLNAVRIFNEKEVDEILIIDIDATVNKQKPNFELIEQLATQCRMPFTYGGGIKNTEEVEKIIQLGVEKVAISSAAIKNPNFIRQAAEKVGSQSIALVADTRKYQKGYKVYTHNGNKETDYSPESLAKLAEENGAGEFIINNIDRDGMGNGYDTQLIRNCRESCNIPITSLGGAGSLEDLKNLIINFPIIGAGAGSLFVFKGKYRAVLINYPERNIKNEIFSSTISKN